MTWLRDKLNAAKEWCARVIHCHHNARCLAAMEWRLGVILGEATGGKMSSPYYDTNTMLDAVRGHHSEEYLLGWADAMIETKEGRA